MPRLEFGWTCALLSPEGGVCVRWCNVVPFQAAGQGISREDSAAQPGAERLQARQPPARAEIHSPPGPTGCSLDRAPLPAFSVPGLSGSGG
mgnify:CR=1 FL=1